MQDTERKNNKPTWKCASLATTLSTGVPPNASPVLLNTGSTNNAIKKVPKTLVCTVLSMPSFLTNVGIATPAFSTTTSTLSSPSNLLQNAIMDAYSFKSTCHTSKIVLDEGLDASIESRAASPFSTDRHAIITLSALRRAKWRAASRPVFEYVCENWPSTSKQRTDLVLYSHPLR